MRLDGGIKTMGICRNLVMQLGSLRCVLHAFLIDLEDIDMVLDWKLHTMREMVVDWKLHTMKVNMGDTWVLLQNRGNVV